MAQRRCAAAALCWLAMLAPDSCAHLVCDFYHGQMGGPVPSVQIDGVASMETCLAAVRDQQPRANGVSYSDTGWWWFSDDSCLAGFDITGLQPAWTADWKSWKSCKLESTGATCNACVDDPSFRDISGYSCVDWEGWDCTGGDYMWTDYAPQELQAIASRCRDSCGFCDFCVEVDENPSAESAACVVGDYSDVDRTPTSDMHD